MKRKTVLFVVLLILLATLSACSNYSEKQAEGFSLFGADVDYQTEYWSYLDGYCITNVHFSNTNMRKVIIPEYYDDGTNGRKPVVVIGRYAISWAPNTLKELILPDTLLNINEYAFWGCHNLPSITIPKNVNLIQQGAFSGCYNLETIKVDPQNETFLVENNCLYSPSMYLGEVVLVAGCSDSVIPLDKGITRIDSGAFYGREGLKNVVIPETVNQIGDVAFANCKEITEIILPDGVRAIGGQCFYNCAALKEVTLSPVLTCIPREAFFFCTSLESIDIPDSAQYVGEGAFNSCRKLKSVTLGSGIDTIENHAFYGCLELSELTIPEKTKYLSCRFIYNCPSMKKLNFEKEGKWIMTASQIEYSERCGGIATDTKKIADDVVLFTGVGNHYKYYLYRADEFDPNTAE